MTLHRGPLGPPPPVVEVLGIPLRRERGIEKDPLRSALEARKRYLGGAFSHEVQVRENHVSLSTKCSWVWSGSELSLELAPFLANGTEGVLEGVRPSGGCQDRGGSSGPSDPLDGFEECL